jgi:hypothetical protein
MATLNDITAKFDELKPGLEADYVRYVTETLTRLINKHGEKVRDLYNAWGEEGHLFRAFSMMVIYPTKAFGQMTNGDVPTINHERIKAMGKRYADDQIAAFTMKLTRKLGALQNVEIFDLSVNAFEFTIQGELGNELVRVQQSRIINCSTKGKLFHQWPARIYVNGKPTSEAAFKRLAA